MLSGAPYAAGLALLLATGCQSGQSERDERAATARADLLHSQAMALQRNPRKLAQAARLHWAEVELRPPGDVRGLECLSLSADLMIYTRRLREGKRLVKKAAEDALERGDHALAARAYAELVRFAERQGRQGDVGRFTELAKALKDSLQGAQK